MTEESGGGVDEVRVMAFYFAAHFVSDFIWIEVSLRKKERKKKKM